MGRRVRRIGVVVLAGAMILTLAACRRDVNDIITSHRDGQMADFGATVSLNGVIPPHYVDGGTLTVQGVQVAYTPSTTDPNRPWTATVTMSGGLITEIPVVYTDPRGVENRQIITLIDHPSTPDAPGAVAEDGVGLRFTNTGLDALGPIIQGLASGSFDVAGILVGQPVNSSDATGTVTDAGLGNLNLVPTATANGVRATVTMADMTLGINLNVSTLGVGYCRLEVDVPTATIDGWYDLGPDPSDPSTVDVNLLGSSAGSTDRQVSVSIPTINYEFTDGNCDPDTFLIGPIISSIAGSSVPDTIRSSFRDQLKDPDGTGPADAVIADAVEEALAGISITGPVGDAVGAHLSAPIQAITEDASGMTFRNDADFATIDPDTLLQTCVPAPGAPDIGETATIPSTFPTFGATTPSGSPYGLGLAISSSAFNQLLGAMTECGLLNSSITELFGQPITPALLSALLPEFADLIPSGTHSIEIRVRPTAAPYLTGDTGPSGERAELMVPNLQLDFVQTAYFGNDGTVIQNPTGLKYLTVAIDAPFGFDLAFDSASSELTPVLTVPPAGTVDARVVYNNLQTAELPAETLFETAFPVLASGIGDTFAAFPLPAFLGLSMDVVEIAESNDTWLLYADLQSAPAVKLTGVGATNTSSAAFETDSPTFNSNQFRHRLRKVWGTDNARFQWQGGIYTDACCALAAAGSDSDYQRTGSYTTTFTVNPSTPGGNWQVDLGQSMRGALTIVDDGSGLAHAYVSSVTGSYRVGGGSPVAFNLTPSPTSLSRDNASGNSGFSGSSSTRITGTGTQTVTVSISFTIRAHSDSDTFGAGLEAAVRMGMADTLANGYTAGAYPYQNPYTSQRDPSLDGHFLTVKACEVQGGGAACP